MNHFSQLRHPGPRGFALIEALIAVVVLATGLLALTALQGALMRSSADSKARSQVAAYVTSELDRIRTGDVVAAKSATSTGTDDISLTARAAGLSALSQTVTSATYYADAGGSFSTTNPNTGKNANFRRITLNLAWTDAAGGTRGMSMTTDISPLALTSSKVLVDRAPSTDTGLRPIVRRQTPVTDGMIPIATGGADGEQTAATNPKPKLLGGDNGSYVSDTRFDVLTYSSDAPANFARFNKRIETAIVGCTCQNSDAGFTGTGPGADLRTFLGQKGYRPAYWTGTSYKSPAIAVDPVTTSPASVPQSAICDVCCRDHKDPVTESGPKFSPWPNQTAAHYRVDSTTNSLVVAGAGDPYLEACRVIRVDGVFRVAADPKIQDNALVATQYYPSTATSGSQLGSVSNNNAATSPQLSTDGKSAYVNYVYDAVSSLFFSTSDVAGTGNATDFSAIQAMSSANTTLNAPDYVPIKPTADRRWLHSRIVMTDYLTDEARQRLVNAALDCDPTATAAQRAQCVLPYIPMATVNTTEIAQWTPRAKDAVDTVPASLVSLAPEYLNFARSSVRRYNSGLALFNIINPTDNAGPAQDEQLFVQLSALPPSKALWLSTPSPNPSTARFFGNTTNPMRGYAETSPPLKFSLNWNFPNNPKSPVSGSATSDDPTATVTGATDCTPNTGANNTTNPHACTAADTTNVELALAGYNRIEYNKISNPCATGSSTSDKPQCVVYTFTGASVDAPSGTVASATVVDSSKAGKVGEVIRFTLPKINGAADPAQSTVTVNFSVTQPESTYQCVNNQPVWTIPCQ